MTDPKNVLLLLLVLVTIGFIAYWITAVRRTHGKVTLPAAKQVLIGLVTAFFDTLGIGSFAPTTAWFKFSRSVSDEHIPGTLNVGHSLAAITQALIYIQIVEVEFVTMLVLIIAAVLGSWIGAGFVARWSRRRIQWGMGTALLAAALLFFMRNMNLGPQGGEELALRGTLLGIGIAGNFLLGALMTLGIGLFAPCLIMISLLGMNPIAAFPIMMGSCAFLMPIASMRFIRAGRYDLRAALGLTIGGLPAVLLAAFIVKALPLVALRWLVMVVVLYAAITMLRAAMRKEPEGETRPRT